MEMIRFLVFAVVVSLVVDFVCLRLFLRVRASRLIVATIVMNAVYFSVIAVFIFFRFFEYALGFIIFGLSRTTMGHILFPLGELSIVMWAIFFAFIIRVLLKSLFGMKLLPNISKKRLIKVLLLSNGLSVLTTSILMLFWLVS